MTAILALGVITLLLDCALIWAALAVAARADELAGER